MFEILKRITGYIYIYFINEDMVLFFYEKIWFLALKIRQKIRFFIEDKLKK